MREELDADSADTDHHDTGRPDTDHPHTDHPHTDHQDHHSDAGHPDTTGDAQVDEALRSLDQLRDLAVHEHAAVVETVHRKLQDRLTGEAYASPAEEG